MGPVVEPAVVKVQLEGVEENQIRVHSFTILPSNPSAFLPTDEST
jgi:hypothetical protein